MNLVTIILILIQIFWISACTKGKQFHTATTPAKTTYSPPKPVIHEDRGVRFIRGATQIADVHVTVFQDLKSIQLSAELDFYRLNGAHLRKTEILMKGKMDEKGFIILHQDKKIEETLKKENIRIAAKATCLSMNNSCTHLFIDIYGYIDKQIYHHQIESQMSPSDIEQLTGIKIVHEENKLKDEHLKEGLEADIEEESDGFDDENGYYVGSIPEDIQHLLFEDQTITEQSNALEKQKQEKKKQHNQESINIDKKGEKKPIPKNQNTIPFRDQVISSTGKATIGTLHDAIDVLEYDRKNSPTGFRILYPKNGAYYATSEMTYILVQMGGFTKKSVSSYVLGIGDISRKNGGKLGGHKSHQQGLDADISYYIRNQYQPRGLNDIVQNDKPNKDWLIDKQWELFKHTVKTTYVDRILVDHALKMALCRYARSKSELTESTKSSDLAFQTLRRLRVVTNHQDHFHIRVKCSVLQVRCRMMADPPQTTDCP